jgi:hypothetical protein
VKTLRLPVGTASDRGSVGAASLGAYLAGRGHNSFGKGAYQAHRLLLRRTPGATATYPPRGGPDPALSGQSRSGRGPGDIRAGEGTAPTRVMGPGPIATPRGRPGGGSRRAASDDHRLVVEARRCTARGPGHTRAHAARRRAAVLAGGEHVAQERAVARRLAAVGRVAAVVALAGAGEPQLGGVEVARSAEVALGRGRRGRRRGRRCGRRGRRGRRGSPWWPASRAWRRAGVTQAPGDPRHIHVLIRSTPVQPLLDQCEALVEPEARRASAGRQELFLLGRRSQSEAVGLLDRSDSAHNTEHTFARGQNAPLSAHEEAGGGALAFRA